ncbi:MAG: 2Fe-2S iron-sulfur cluster binding domain-containing protein [Thaumarchaeota archaeon]|nr:2Fe-2S iron-sulfur cluster binding domain-containing protein [Nitrososphaerota archaeon]
MKIKLNINGTNYESDVEPRMLLVDFIRDVAGLKGTHVGCETGSCGSCMVLLDGMPVKSCLMLAVQAEGKKIITVEGLSGKNGLNKVQKALSERKALQCGFCAAGFSIIGTWILDNEENVDYQKVKEDIAGVVCRCSGYDQIIKTITEVAKNE